MRGREIVFGAEAGGGAPNQWRTMESDKLHVGPFASYGSTAGSSTVQEDFKGVGDHSVAFLDVSYAVTQGVRICSKP